MRTILRIMKIELGIFFFSPIAWLVLVVFTFQLGMTFCDGYENILRSLALGYNVSGMTSRIIGSVMSEMLYNLYLYIPLLTMGLISRELNSGSIKLLYSSPVSNIQIIIGKYLSVLVYGLILVILLFIPMIFIAFTIGNADIPFMLTTLLGLYLTISAYAAIGLFMSTITKYQVVAVVGTLIILAVLNFIGGVGQEIAFVRDLTYWLSISGRSRVFLDGMICSKDILYFILVIFLFLSLSVIKLQGERSKSSMWLTISKYTSVFVIALMIGYVSSLPKMIVYHDSTYAKSNTLTKESQDIIKELDGGLTITTYVNLLDDTYYIGSPAARNRDIERFEKYIRFKPEIKMEYVYYYGKCFNERLYKRYPGKTEKEIMEDMCIGSSFDTDMFISAEEVQKMDDISSENGRFVRVIKRENGSRAFLRVYADQQVHPHESEITTAFKTLICKSSRVGFTIGHSERGSQDYSDRGFGIFARNNTFRYSLVNRGFEVYDLSLEKAVPDDVDILVIADMRSYMNDEESKNLDDFIARGGNLFILGEPKRIEFMNPVLNKLGLKFAKGILVHPTKQYLDDIIAAKITPETVKINPQFDYIRRRGYSIITPSACAVEKIEDKGFNVTEILKTPEKGSWIETTTKDFINEKSECNVNVGELEKSNAVMLNLNRKINNKIQNIFVIGDADCISGAELSAKRAGLNGNNFSLITEVFRTLSNDEYPVKTVRVRPIDNTCSLTQSSTWWIKGFFMWLLPLSILMFSILLLIRRKRK